MRARTLLALSVAASFSTAAPAAAVDCISLTVGMAPFLCANTFSRATAQGVVGGNSTTAGVTFQNLTGGSADNISSGNGGMSGVARAEVDWGVLRAFASADNGQFTMYAPLESESRVVSFAEVAFGDIVTIASSTLPAGTPVEITVTMGIDGGFSEEGAGGQATLTLSKVSNFVGFYQERQAILFYDGGFVPPPFALTNYFVGDQIIFKLSMRANVGTTNQVIPPVTSAAADMEGTGTLLIEVATPNVTLDAVSEHDYTTVPEPGRALLVAVAALLLGGRALGSRRARASR
jgi:hypothetical protein